MSRLSRVQLAGMIDHTLLKPEATPMQIDKLCDEALAHGFAAVCVNPVQVRRCAQRLRGSEVVVAAVAGFPLGASLTATKVDETRRAIDDGALEVDMVLRVGDLVAGEVSAVREDIAAVAEAVHTASPKHILKVIFETAALSDQKIVAACGVCADVGADFVKTSTGFHPKGGATVHAIRLMRRHAGSMRIKAAGGIRNLTMAQAMIDAGASRLGLSASVKLISGIPLRFERPPGRFAI
jgi:deoxyribose-phosphate aldolase